MPDIQQGVGTQGHAHRWRHKTAIRAAERFHHRGYVCLRNSCDRRDVAQARRRAHVLFADAALRQAAKHNLGDLPLRIGQFLQNLVGVVRQGA
jgi:hypothetical protein